MGKLAITLVLLAATASAATAQTRQVCTTTAVGNGQWVTTCTDLGPAITHRDSCFQVGACQ